MSKENINLPKTAFSMKANLQNKEPGMVDYWDKIELYNKVLEIYKKTCILCDSRIVKVPSGQ